MLYVTDTHPLVYFSTGRTRKLGQQARRAFQQAVRGRGHIVIPITVLEEILRLSEMGRVRLKLPLRELVSQYRQQGSPFSVQDYSVDILLAVEQFPAIRDPFDRVIVATAHTLGYPLITHDGFLQDHQFVQTVW